MQKYAHETVVGIFVIIGLVCVGYMTVKLGNVSLFGDNSYTLYARFNSVSGLRVGNSVEMLGMEIGKVAGFKMDQEDLLAQVELRIKQGIKVYGDAIASIKTAGLIGDKYDSIDKIKNVKAPLLVVHGKLDMIVPFKFGKKVFDAANQPKEMMEIPAAGHNNLYVFGAGQRVLHFLSGLPQK